MHFKTHNYVNQMLKSINYEFNCSMKVIVLRDELFRELGEKTKLISKYTAGNELGIFFYDNEGISHKNNLEFIDSAVTHLRTVGILLIRIAKLKLG